MTRRGRYVQRGLESSNSFANSRLWPMSQLHTQSVITPCEAISNMSPIRELIVSFYVKGAFSWSAGGTWMNLSMVHLSPPARAEMPSLLSLLIKESFWYPSLLQSLWWTPPRRTLTTLTNHRGGNGEQSVKRFQQVSDSGYLVKRIIIQGAEAAVMDPIHELRFNYNTPSFFTWGYFTEQLIPRFPCLFVYCINRTNMFDVLERINSYG